MSEKVEALFVKARAAQAQIADYTQEQVDEMVRVIAKYCWNDRERIAEMCWKTTGKGTYEFKLAKMEKTTAATYSYLRGRKSVGLIEHNEEKRLWKYAKPVGVIGCVAPVTNPDVTAINNSMISLKCRNAIIVCPHPGAKEVSQATVDLMRSALRDGGFPEDLIQQVPDSTLEDTREVMATCDLILATGGPGMVKAAYSSGKPALGVGQGNCQSVMDPDYDDIDYMVENICTQRMLDFGMPCTGEQTLHLPREKMDAVIASYKSLKGYYIGDPELIQKLRETLFIDGQINRAIVGQPSYVVCKMAGIDIPEDTTILLLKVDKCGKDEVLAKEILAPITRLFPYDKYEEAVERATTNLKMEGAGHSCSVWSNNMERVQQLAEKLPAGRLVVNQPATCGSGRQWNGLPMTASLGCGYWGGNSVGHNVNYKDLLNYTIVAEVIPDKPILSDEEIMKEILA